ncbi:nickel-responsive transcriptional regulator NikR [Elusimicrobiota bacterium]
MMSKIRRFGVSVSREILDQFDIYIKDRNYPTRSKAIEDIIRETLKKKFLKTGSKGTGAVVLVYDHHKRELVSRLTDIQHDFHGLVICNQHVHLDHHNCMEIIVVRGTHKQMQEITDRIQSAKGVKSVSLSIAEAH